MGKRKTKRATPAVDVLPGLGSHWRRLQAIYSVGSALRPRRHWVEGRSERMASNRLEGLVGAREARRAAHVLHGLPLSDLRRLLVAARINHEQSQAAARLAVLFNVTGVIAMVVISNQLFPGWITQTWQSADATDRSILAFLAGVGVAVSACYGMWAYGAVASSRDLRHVLELRIAGMEDGAQEVPDRLPGDATPEPVGVVEDLRSAQLSDI